MQNTEARLRNLMHGVIESVNGQPEAGVKLFLDDLAKTRDFDLLWELFSEDSRRHAARSLFLDVREDMRKKLRKMTPVVKPTAFTPTYKWSTPSEPSPTPSHTPSRASSPGVLSPEKLAERRQTGLTAMIALERESWLYRFQINGQSIADVTVEEAMRVADNYGVRRKFILLMSNGLPPGAYFRDFIRPGEADIFMKAAEANPN